MRVISGRLGGRKLRTVPGRGTRPTSDRVRQALFDWLGGTLEGRVLDLFAGTGALGIEALSRGAGDAVFVESARAALVVLGRNLDELGLASGARVLAMPVRRALARLRGEPGFDWIFADPPYASDARQWLVGGDGAVELLVPGGSLLCERSARSEPAPDPDARLEWCGERVWGESAFDWYRRDQGVPPA